MSKAEKQLLAEFDKERKKVERWLTKDEK